MIEQLSNAVKFLAFFVASKVGATGLTVTVDVYNPAGTKIVTAASATEIGGGLYSYTLASGSTGTEGEYVAIFKTSGTADQQHIPALWVIGRAGVEDLDAAISSRNATAPPAASAVADAVWDEAISGHGSAGTTGQALGAAGAASDPLLNAVPGAYASGTAGAALGKIGSGQIMTVSPVAQSGDVSIIRGDDYLAADARALEWTDADASWPDLTSATISADMDNGLTFAGSVVNADKVRVELTDVQTRSLMFGDRAFSVRATLSDGSRVTLLSGTWRSRDR